jgi:peptide/nickel transport system substrate-binding protein
MDPDRNVTPTLSVIESGVYQTLLKLSPDTHEPQPALATAFKPSDDAKTYTFTLDSKAKFSDDSPVTSADVLF